MKMPNNNRKYAQNYLETKKPFHFCASLPGSPNFLFPAKCFT